MAGQQLVEISRHTGQIVVLRMQNPPVNAWTDEFVEAMEEALVRLEASTARAVVITGAGRHFSAGGDFHRFQTITDAATAREFVERVQGFMDRVAALPMPVIAAVSGTALGGGCELAMACDVRVAGPRARMGLPEVRWGVLAGAGGTQRLSRLVGPGMAKRMMYTAEPVDAVTALRIGLVEEVSDDDDPLPLALELAQKMAANSPRAIRAVKQCVDRGLDMGLADGLELERELWIELIPGGDLQEGAAAFFDQRDPRYPDPR
ncbi:enoyl-CoA hydratase/isomerase family protein [uncultured Dietzia sp.]|uniref:enoyl-CoA hydratase/isomerase family protein n=1 Tax=uncultured Dietzia sp. TaxID=395519 RepID=UPI00262070B7|nr:enoyl-CoA hydratase/isomerase family protein [uncultured Dietzia sp.]HMT51277.1 enoyl-CoA hydratase/isomerase family protein [Dietzia sp.]